MIKINRKHMENSPHEVMLDAASVTNISPTFFATVNFYSNGSVAYTKDDYNVKDAGLDKVAFGKVIETAEKWLIESKNPDFAGGTIE